MKNYLRWGLRQLYLFYFRPTEFRREVKVVKPDESRFDKRFRYMLKILPFLVLWVFFCTFAVGYIIEAFGVAFEWEEALVGIASGILFGVACGILFGEEFGMAFGIAFGIAFGVAGGVMNSVLSSGLRRVTRKVDSGGEGSALSGNPRMISYETVGWEPPTLADVYIPALFASAALVLWTNYCRKLVMYLPAAFVSILTYAIARRRAQAAIRAWRWCPVASAEVILRPLPLVGEQLALVAKQDRKEGFKQIAFVAAERPLERRAALDALVEVAAADLKVDTLSQLSDVTERLSWTTDAPASLPNELAATLPRLDRVAQHVGQYLILHSAYRKGQALERAVKEVEALQQSLIVADGQFTLRLLRVVNEWRGLLDAERHRMQTLAEAAREIPNPFVYGNAVVETEHNVFTGRRDVVRQIEASLLGAAQAPTLLLQGPRRMGKTSILNQLPRLLGPDFAAAVVDCQNPAVTGSEATLLRYLSRALSEGLRRRRVSVEELKAQQLAREPYAVFDEWLEKVERAMPAGMRALLCLDEYERLQSALAAGWGAPFLDSLRHTFQHRPRVVLMFTGAHTFQELGPAWTDRFISARRMRVSFLTREDVELLLTRPIPEFDMTYASGALDALVAATSCHPFLTQAVAFELVQLLNEGERREATRTDVEEAVGRALVSGDAYFVNVWGDAGAEGQAILKSLAAGETQPDLPNARAWLREHDVLGADGGFAVEMMRRWVVSKAAAV